MQLLIPSIGGYLTYRFLWHDIINIRTQLKELLLPTYTVGFITWQPYGYKCTIHVKKDGNLEHFNTFIGTFEKRFKCKAYVEDIEYSNKITLNLVNILKDLKFEHLNLSPYELLLGYNYKYEPIIVNMKITPHMGVVGISNNGKSKCIENALRNLEGAEIHLLNCMSTDFICIGDKRINNHVDILDYLYYITHENNPRDKPLYIVLDEYNVLNSLKGLDNALEDLLRQARHRNTFLIVLGQQMNKEECNFKNLFNCRLCFKQIGSVQYYTFLGTSPEHTNLKQREFILQHTKMEYGKSYLME